MRFSLCLIAAVGCISSAMGQPLLNGGFESAQGNAPADWQYSCANECKGSLFVDTEVKAEGRQSVRLASQSERAPHVYCGIAQDLKPLVPGVEYRLTFRAKGEGVGECWYGGGPAWQLRCAFPQGDFDWQEFEFEWAMPADQDSFHFRINVDSVTKALWIDDLRLVDEKVLIEQAESGIAAQEARLPELDAQLDAAKADGAPVPYPQSDVVIARMFCGFCRDDIANKRYSRAVQVATEVQELLDRASREMRVGLDAPVWKVGTEEIRDGSLWGTCTFGGKEEVRPIFLTGYGHFDTVVRAIPTLAQIGINVIQIEIGPNSIVNEDMSVHTDAIENRVMKALDFARDHGISICLLLSPHYFPDWAFQKWPEIRVPSGFMKNTTEAPQVRAIYDKFLRTIIPMIKDHPALNSICLSNEPVSMASPQDPFRLPLWREYIKKKHGTIEAVNALYGTSYASFEDVPHPAMNDTDPPAAYYDAVRFNQERFAEWHAWMAGIIHEMAPDLPCHAKVMALPPGRHATEWGTDPWEFAQLSQFNGDDCYFMPHNGNLPWESMWQIQNAYYDLQRSMKRVPVFNTENHIIADREQRYVSPDHIYTAIWQGAIHGQGASTTWAWERTYDVKSDFEGLILHRPACTAAMSRCALDLMRLSREVSAIQNLPPRVAILFSNAALVHDERASGLRSAVYEALNFCGVPIGFVTDEQVAAGWLDKYDCLVVAGARNVLGGALDAIRAYQKAGHLVVEYGGDTMKEDEYRRPVEPVIANESIDVALSGEALRDVLMNALAKAGIAPDIALKTPEGRVPFGVEWRSVPYENGVVMNLVNLTRQAITVSLPDGQWNNLLTIKPCENAIVLEPNTPVLVFKIGT